MAIENAQEIAKIDKHSPSPQTLTMSDTPILILRAQESLRRDQSENAGRHDCPQELEAMDRSDLSKNILSISAVLVGRIGFRPIKITCDNTDRLGIIDCSLYCLLVLVAELIAVWSCVEPDVPPGQTRRESRMRGARVIQRSRPWKNICSVGMVKDACANSIKLVTCDLIFAALWHDCFVVRGAPLCLSQSEVAAMLQQTNDGREDIRVIARLVPTATNCPLRIPTTPPSPSPLVRPPKHLQNPL